jgi:myo-inositol-1(or 4)-monophosphatase
MRELEVAQRAVRAGGEVVARYYREGVTFRSNEQSYNLVSDADVESEAVIAQLIRQAFPDHAVLGEETHRGDPNAPHLWIVDPLDGTSNFAHRLPQFAVSLAYYERGQAVCGVVFNPILGDWFVATRGQGAYFNGQAVRVALHRQLSEALLSVGFSYRRGAVAAATVHAIGDLLGRQIHGVRRFGSAALEMCYVGAGMLSGYFEYELSPWDFAAARLFVEEAGGRVTTCDGAPLPLAKSSLLATNGYLHESLLEVLRTHSPSS